MPSTVRDMYMIAAAIGKRFQVEDSTATYETLLQIQFNLTKSVSRRFR